MADATLPAPLTRDGAVLADALLALGLLLSSATQLRIEGSPVGAGELCLALWLGIRLCGELNRPSRLSPAFFQLLAFWLLFAVAQCIGSIMSLLGEAIRDPFSSRHDTIAYLLVAGVSCVAVMQPDAQYRLRRSAWIAVGLGAISGVQKTATQINDETGCFRVVDNTDVTNPLTPDKLSTSGNQCYCYDKASHAKAAAGQQKVLIGKIALGVGAAAVAGGLVWELLFNKPVPQTTDEKKTGRVQVTPSVGPGMSGVLVHGSF